MGLVTREWVLVLNKVIMVFLLILNILNKKDKNEYKLNIRIFEEEGSLELFYKCFFLVIG